MAYAAKGDLETAEKHVAAAYAEKPDLKDGYARIGWTAFGTKPEERLKAMPYLEKDAGGRSQESGDRSQSVGQSVSESVNQIRSHKSPRRADPPAADKIETHQCRLSPVHMLNLAQLRAQNGEFEKAIPLVEQAYKLNDAIKDGYARTAWAYYWPKKEYAKVVEWMERDCRSVNQSGSESVNQSGSASVNQIANPKSQIKNRQCRLSPPWLLNRAKAIAMTHGMEYAIPFVEEAYEANPKLKNGFGQVAWSCFIPEGMAYEKVIPYFEKDIERGALAGDWQLNYSQALAVVGRESEAEKIVEDAYAQNPNLKNGFARCGLQRHFLFYCEPERAVKCFERDRERRALVGQYRIQYVSALAAAGRLDEALAEVKKAYAEDSTVKNGYALVGWYYYVVRLRQPEKALVLFEKDSSFDRLASGCVLLHAAIYARLGDLKRSDKMIKEAYRLIPNIGGGYTLASFNVNAVSIDWTYLKKMIEKDIAINRLRPPFLHVIYLMVSQRQRWKHDRNGWEATDVSISPSYFNLSRSWLLRFSCKDVASAIIDIMHSKEVVD